MLCLDRATIPQRESRLGQKIERHVRIERIEPHVGVDCVDRSRGVTDEGQHTGDRVMSLCEIGCQGSGASWTSRVRQMSPPLARASTRVAMFTPSSSGACHCSQVSEARRIAEADRYRHGSRDRRHEGKIVRQFEQVGNCGGESNIAMKCYAVFSTVAHLCAPVAGQSVLIEEDHGETSNFYGF